MEDQLALDDEDIDGDCEGMKKTVNNEGYREKLFLKYYVPFSFGHCTLYCCGRNKFAVKAMLCNTPYFYIVDSDM